MSNEDVKIVEYEPALAAALADMWNRSGDSWGGYSIAFTEESVRASEASAVYENNYLAMIGDEVVGCCKIARWTEGEGALYVEVLNVRPDLHGRKIGKALMRRAVDRTIELDWPRLDLHTWPGNTKAVPLYKKTGFFWEERDREVYLVNFIPFVLKTELVADFFSTADWYADSTRDIVVEPDGRKENGFTYFKYSWEKDDRYLEMEFARRGRGLRRIHTNDFTITATVLKAKAVSGRNYEVVYQIENRTGKPAEVGVWGSDDGPIRFSLKEERVIGETAEIRGSFFVDTIEKKQSEWKTHPRVAADIRFNGKSARFEVGVEPQFPAELRIKRRSGVFDSIAAQPLMLDVESHLDADARISVHLPDLEGCVFANDMVETDVPAFGRKSIRIDLEEAKAGIYSGTAEVLARTNSDTIEFPFQIDFELPDLTAVYHGTRRVDDSTREYVAAVGAYSIGLAFERDSFRNEIRVRDAVSVGRVAEFATPKLGKPYSEEFIHRAPDAIRCEETTGGLLLSATLESNSFPGVSLEIHCKITAGGRIERWFTVSADETFSPGNPVYIHDSFWSHTSLPVVPYDGTIIEAGFALEAGVYSWESERFTENWIFMRRESGNVGIFWAPGVKLKCQEWDFAIEHEIGDLRPGSSVDTPAVTIIVGRFKDWRGFRNYVTGIDSRMTPTGEVVDIALNHRNPFVGSELPFEIVEHRLRDFSGSLEISGGAQDLRMQPDPADARRLVGAVGAPERTGTLEFGFEFPVIGYSRKRMVFPSGEGEVCLVDRTEKGHDVLTAYNGVVSISVAPDYGYLAHSCIFDGTEWLGSLFPNHGPRDWWNPWLGGFGSRPGKIDARVALKEPRNACFVDVRDNHGNTWRGIETTIRFGEHESLRGLVLRQYFLLLPGVPVLYHVARIEQGTGTYIPNLDIICEVFLSGPDDSADCDLYFGDRYGKRVRVHSGLEERDFFPDTPIVFRRKDTEANLTVYAHPAVRSYVATNKRTTMIGAREGMPIGDGEKASCAPVFMLFGPAFDDGEALIELSRTEVVEVTPDRRRI